MDDSKQVPEPFRSAQRRLAPFLKQRQEAAQIRQVLASHLSSHVDGGGLSRPLSLVESTCKVIAPPQGIRGLQKEYLRSVRANTKARQEYAELSKEHFRAPDDRTDGKTLSSNLEDSNSSLHTFVGLIQLRQRHQRLRITQDYIDLLSEKPVASTEYLDPGTVLRDVETLPKVPSEVLNGPHANSSLGQTDLKDLVDQLEKAVLRAKVLLKREQKLLAKIRASNTVSPLGGGSRLQALVPTHSELIKWIEFEMAKAGDGPPMAGEELTTNHNEAGKGYVDAHLEMISRQYSRYTKARGNLISTCTSTTAMPVASFTGQVLDQHPTETDDSQNYNNLHTVYPYLEELLAISNEQKTMIQQKSHLTISLSKQLKEANQGMDRLAEESHLLPAHPMPARPQEKGLGAPISFADEVSHLEKPDSSRHAQAWVYASQSAGKSTDTAVLEKLEDGEMAISGTQDIVSELEQLLGESARKGDASKAESCGATSAELSVDIWSILDGSLGAIKGDGLD